MKRRNQSTTTPAIKPKIKVAGYVRVSTLEQVEGTSLETQEDAIKRYCKAMGYQLVRIYRDKGVSGKKKERPGLTELRRDAAAHKFDKVAFKKLSRFGRSAIDLLALYDEFEKEHGIGLVSIEESIDTSTPTGRFMRTILVAVAEFERETIRGLMYEGKMNLLRKNKTFFGNEPYGYEFNFDKDIRKMEELPEEKKTYLEIVDMFLNKGMRMQDIALNLNRRAKPSPQGRRWSTVTVCNILKNEAYTGKKTINKDVYEVREKSSGLKTETVDGKKVRVEKPSSEWVEFKFPPYIDPATFKQIQNRIAFGKRRAKNQKYPDKFLVQGLMKCGSCGGKIGIRNGVERNGDAPHYYTCHWAFAAPKGLELAGKKKRCDMPSAQMQDVDTEIWDKLRKILTYDNETIKQFVSQPKKGDKEKLLKEKERVAADAKSRQAKMRNLIVNFPKDDEKDNEIVKKEVRKEIYQLGEEIKGLNTMESEIDRKLAAMERNAEVLKTAGTFMMVVPRPTGRGRTIFRGDDSYGAALSSTFRRLHDVDKKHIAQMLLSSEAEEPITLRKDGAIDIRFDVDPAKIEAVMEYLKGKNYLPRGYAEWAKLNKTSSQYFREH